MIRFDTERLLIRPWQMEDFDAFLQMEGNPNVGPNAGWAPCSDPETVKEILKGFVERPDEVVAITQKDSGRAIGSLGLHIDEHRDYSMKDEIRMLGYVLDEPYWGRGYMTEAARGALRYAFETLGMEMVTIYHFPFNARSRRVIEKCGFTYEGTLRRTVQRYDGVVLDELCYSMNRAEYEKLTEK
ncbi:MAG: GNAT family N-acetyltransferase [Ruminococcaceae bacterium]|nr:GNAT family N-acetyltransferase [Oscillospiraceae bacterium]